MTGDEPSAKGQDAAAPKFGTSGLRGLVSGLTGEVVAAYTRAFLAACPTGERVFVGHDLRASSPGIAASVVETIVQSGREAVICGPVPTPALALSAMAQGAGAIMVTGSHIPEDRNGLKFYTPEGEITKAGEAAIMSALKAGAAADAPGGRVLCDSDVSAAYATRYLDAFGPEALSGIRVGVWQHSSVARDFLVDLVTALGGDAVPLARSDHFVAVDTEALAPDVPDRMAGWCASQALDAVISTDGDADRPLMADACGRLVAGDVLGVLTARALGARVICTPISSNTMVRSMPDFDRVVNTRIGSPHVIEAMKEILADTPDASVAGYEANGGFLLGFPALAAQGRLAPLMTRDGVLPLVAPLALACRTGQGVADLVNRLPARFTATGRVRGVSTEVSTRFLAALDADFGALAQFFDCANGTAEVDRTDGLRVHFVSGTIVHLRASGNAPEFRCYVEADHAETAGAVLRDTMQRLERALS